MRVCISRSCTRRVDLVRVDPLQQGHRVVVDRAPELGIELAEDGADVRLPGPPEVLGQLAQLAESFVDRFVHRAGDYTLLPPSPARGGILQPRARALGCGRAAEPSPARGDIPPAQGASPGMRRVAEPAPPGAAFGALRRPPPTQGSRPGLGNAAPGGAGMGRGAIFPLDVPPDFSLKSHRREPDRPVPPYTNPMRGRRPLRPAPPGATFGVLRRPPPTQGSRPGLGNAAPGGAGMGRGAIFPLDVPPDFSLKSHRREPDRPVPPYTKTARSESRPHIRA